ncbi:hypothetical protein GCM10009623_09370 [Nocardioides aestuarii]|uniref:Glycosyltransferase RgtA/B/C/D-like domain-containing protein n=1 Tax=Nocardioides aestuarii TaxID=252231 RepID=A0ABW4TL01_9ACTN
MLTHDDTAAERATTDGERRWWQVDPWGPVLSLVGLVIFLLHGFGGLLTRDLALYAYAGQQFAEGVPPYEGVMNRAGPLAHIVPGFGALIARGLGTDDLITQRALMMGLSVVAVWLTYLLGRDTFRSRLAGAASVATLLAFQGFVTYSGGGPREKTTMMLLVVCAMLAVLHRRWFWAGFAIALATLTWQPAFWATIAMAVAGVLVGAEGGRRLTGVVRVALGGIAATALMTLYFVSVGALDAFFDGFLLLNATSTRQIGLVQMLIEEPYEISSGFGWSIWLVVAGLVASVALGVRAWRHGDRRDRHDAAVIAFGIGTAGYVLWSIGVFNGWADAVVMLPFAAIGMGGLGALVLRRVQPRGAAVVAAYTVVVLVVAAVDTWVTRPDELAPMRAETDAMLALAGPEVSVASVGAPQPLVLGQLRNPIQHQMFIAGLQDYLDENYPGGLAGVAAAIDDARPTYITMDHPDWYYWMDPTIDAHYEEVGTTLDFTWYADRSLGEEKLAEMREILESGP